MHSILYTVMPFTHTHAAVSCSQCYACLAIIEATLHIDTRNTPKHACLLSINHAAAALKAHHFIVCAPPHLCLQNLILFCCSLRCMVFKRWMLWNPECDAKFPSTFRTITFTFLAAGYRANSIVSMLPQEVCVVACHVPCAMYYHLLPCVVAWRVPCTIICCHVPCSIICCHVPCTIICCHVLFTAFPSGLPAACVPCMARALHGAVLPAACPAWRCPNLSTSCISVLCVNLPWYSSACAHRWSSTS